MKIGDRVIYDDKMWHCEKATVIDIKNWVDSASVSVQIRFETGETWWAHKEKDIRIDKEWLREQKLKELGI